MKPERFARLRKLLLEASDLPEEKRKAYLEQACEDDPEMRHEAESILADGAASSAILRKAGDVPESALQPGDETPSLPRKIGQYTIKRIIASGGMGVVYEALQEKPRRTVALKVMKTSIASNSALRRFEYESQLLARLTHPGIAQVYEAGTHDDGMGPVPYFAMEYVPDAKSIIEYAEEKKLGTRDRMELFTQVCDAVHHGHQKGIIHRDLKPGNILVNPDGRVKVIDFGVARSTDSDMALTTLQTDVGQLIGTLQYMSPEQCAADPNDIDTRSDVYALGVVQYELLCGQLPYDVRKKAFHEVTRVIREEPPTRPSSISKKLRGDVETITLKALEKDRDRRYQSAVELAQDIRRYLSGEAIVGRPPSMIYQLRIIARRHRAILVSLIAIFVVMATGLAVSTGMYFRAEQAREETAKERDRALTAEQEAEKRRAEAEAVTTFLSDTLAAVDPSEAQGKEVTVREMLDKAAEKIEPSLAEQPLVEAALRATIGITYSALGEYGNAEPHLKTAWQIRKEELGEEHVHTLESMISLGKLFYRVSRYEEAEALLSRAREICHRVLGEEHTNTMDATFMLGQLKFRYGQFTEAVQIQSQILKLQQRSLGEEHPDTLNSMIRLVGLKSDENKYSEAELLGKEALEICRRVFGDSHPLTLSALKSLAYVYFAWGKYDEAVTTELQRLELCRLTYGDDHPETVRSMNSLGVYYVAQNRYEEGEQLIRESYERIRRTLGERHADTLLFQNNLGWMYERQGRNSDAEKVYRSVLEIRQQEYGKDFRGTVGSVGQLARVLVTQGQYGEAEGLVLRALAHYKSVRPNDLTTNAMKMLYGTCLLRTGRFIEAESVLLEAQEILKTSQKINSRPKAQVIELLVELYDAWGKPEQAAEWRAKLPEGANP